MLQNIQRRPNRTSATRLHSEHNVGRFLRSGETCGHICDESRLHAQSVLNPNIPHNRTYPALLLALRECLLDAVHGGVVFTVEQQRDKEN